MSDHIQHQEMLTPEGEKFLLIHFLYRSPKGTVKVQGEPLVPVEMAWVLACEPRLQEMHATRKRGIPLKRTDDPRGVTCPHCKATEEWRSAARANGMKI